MAESLDDGEFWLPPEFLTDDDLAMEKYETDTHEATKGSLLSFEVPYMGFGSFGTSSDLSSPVESVVGSSETESDEEDYLVGLTRQMARSTLAETALSSDKSKVFGEKKKKAFSVLYCSYATIYFCGVSDLVLIFFFAGLGCVRFTTIDPMWVQAGLEQRKSKRPFSGLEPSGDLGSALRCSRGSG